MDKLEQARQDYQEGKIEFMDLHRIFFEEASEEQKEYFRSVPVFDRGWVIEGKSEEERNALFNEYTSEY